MISVLVTGANGQLGKCLQDVVKGAESLNWNFKTSKELDVTNNDILRTLFNDEKFDFVINCAAYTAVDKAESDEEKAFLVNAEALKYLADLCYLNNTTLIHISTDFVFDGRKNTPYTEDDTTNPINIYGASKLQGETYVKDILEKYYIIRTSWVYSEYGNNFVKTMLRLSQERDKVNVVNDQQGSPTYAGDLAKVLVDIINNESNKYGTYNFSNEGETNWYEFAKTIFEFSDIKIKLNPIKSEAYVSLAERPLYSVLDKAKVKEVFQIEIPHWKDSLNTAINIS